MSVGCPSRSLVSSTSPFVSLLTSFSLSFFIYLYSSTGTSPSIPGHPLAPPRASSIYTGPRFRLSSFTSSPSPSVSSARLALSYLLSAVCLPGVFSIDYKTTIDLPDCARDRGRCASESTETRQQLDRMVDREEEGKREKETERMHTGIVDGKNEEAGLRFRVTRTRWALPYVGTCQNRSGTAHVSLACSFVAVTLTVIVNRSPIDLSLNSAEILWDFSFTTRTGCSIFQMDDYFERL